MKKLILNWTNLSSRLSKVQADNQITISTIREKEQQLLEIGDTTNFIGSQPEDLDEEKILPGSSQPQDLGSISYKETETKLEQIQQLHSLVETTSTVVTETFVQSEEKLLPEHEVLKINMSLLLVF